MEDERLGDEPMIYGGKQMAESFRTVRKNTIMLAEEIPAEKYDFRPAPDVRTIGEQLAHITVSARWQIDVHGDRKTMIDFETFARRMAQSAAEEKALRSKDEIVAALRADGETFAAFLEAADDGLLQEEVSFPPPVQPATKSRLEMLLATKEHEMHHRGQLMLAQRILGIVPHLTRQRVAFAAAGAGDKP
jgi:uncharacterized damage-inducible protein DinB